MIDLGITLALLIEAILGIGIVVGCAVGICLGLWRHR